MCTADPETAEVSREGVLEAGTPSLLVDGEELIALEGAPGAESDASVDASSRRTRCDGRAVSTEGAASAESTSWVGELWAEL